MNQTECDDTCQHKQVSPSICTLCYDYLLVFDETCSLENLRPFVTLKCGHLFHSSCINNWFKSPFCQGNDPTLKSCPYCRRETRRCEIRRLCPISAGDDVYPVYGESSNSISTGQNGIHGACNRKKFRPAPTTCAICYEYIMVYNNAATEDGGPTDVAELRPIITLKCGHYFHTTCINDYWFGVSLQGNDRTLKPCPYCRREMKRWETRRIFPTIPRVELGEE